MIRRVPDTASVAHPAKGARLFAPPSERNRAPLCALLKQIAPDQGTALELASGTGQHIVAFAAQHPDLSWQPTEPDPLRRASIDAYAADAALPNLSPARDLNAATPGWGQAHPGQALIVLINLLHLISTAETRILITEAAQALAPGGRFVIYGPFMRAGKLTSDGDKSFHASLIAQDPDIGYKDDADLRDLARAAGLIPTGVRDLPANNLAIVLQKPDT